MLPRFFAPICRRQGSSPWFLSCDVDLKVNVRKLETGLGNIKNERKCAWLREQCLYFLDKRSTKVLGVSSSFFILHKKANTDPNTRSFEPQHARFTVGRHHHRQAVEPWLLINASVLRCSVLQTPLASSSLQESFCAARAFLEQSAIRRMIWCVSI